MLREFLGNDPCGCFKCSGKRLVLSAEHTSPTNRFSHDRCHHSFGAQGVTGYSRQGFQGNVGVLGIEFREGTVLSVRLHSQCGRAMYSRDSIGRVEEGFVSVPAVFLHDTVGPREEDSGAEESDMDEDLPLDVFWIFVRDINERFQEMNAGDADQ